MMNGFMKRMLIVGVLSLLLTNSLTQAIANEAGSDSMREEREIFINLKPTPFLVFGFGLEVGSYLSEDIAMGVNVELDHFLVGGAGFAGFFGRRYFGDSFFTQAGLGYSESFFHSYTQRDLAVHFVIGKDYQEPSGLVLGVDWIGIHKQLTHEDWAISFPKIRIGWSF